MIFTKSSFSIKNNIFQKKILHYCIKCVLIFHFNRLSLKASFSQKSTISQIASVILAELHSYFRSGPWCLSNWITIQNYLWWRCFSYFINSFLCLVEFNSVFFSNFNYLLLFFTKQIIEFS